MKPKPFQGQKYDQIRAKCERKRKLFTDPVFPPNNKSLSLKKQPPSGITWKRPGDLVNDPKLFVEGTSASDFTQGELGNCWFVATCSCIAQEPVLVKRIVPDTKSQEWRHGNRYTGVFHFHFYHFGEWHDVVIDDFLPTRNNKLLYVHSQTPNVFWSALLEKAYAKFFGNYEALESGIARDAMVDMMGGIGERVDMKEIRGKKKMKKKLFSEMKESFENHSLMAASLGEGREKVQPNGLVTGHAYGITDVREVKIGSGIIAFFKRATIEMVRLRNPWGRRGWTGPWSDNSPEWKKISKKEKKAMGLVFSDDGEFWMSYDDFCEVFNQMDVCHLINTSNFSFKKTWKESVRYGSWSKATSGGCPNHKATFLNNPQYMFDVSKDGEEIMISLDQEDSRFERKAKKENENIGFAVIKADMNREYRMHDYWDKSHSSSYVASRSVFKRFNMKKGRYILVPSTFDPGRTGRYYLRVYSEKNINLRDLSKNGPKPGGCCCFGPTFKLATQIRVLKAEGIGSGKHAGVGDSYCIIKCEGKEVRTPLCLATNCPEWDCRATFYRKKPRSDVLIEVWSKNNLRDALLGVVRFQGSVYSTEDGFVQHEQLYGIGKEKNVKKMGILHVQIKQISKIDKA